MKMKGLSHLFLLFIGLLFVSVSSQQPPPEVKDIDQLQFVYRWPVTYCRDSTKKCTSPFPLKFTLVRFAGTNSVGQPFVNCRDGAGNSWQNNFFTRQVQGKLKEFWPPLEGEKPQDFWTKAWKTHGTCTAKLMTKPEEYFNNAIKFSENIMGVLLKDHLIKQDGIVPCDTATYTNDKLHFSFYKAAKNKSVSVTHKQINATHSYLDEVTFCYNTKFYAFEDCRPHHKIIIPRP